MKSSAANKSMKINRPNNISKNNASRQTTFNATLPGSMNEAVTSTELPHPEPNERLVTKIVDQIFQQQTGYYEASSSTCPEVALTTSTSSEDRRLKRWQEILEDRQRLAERIMARTGKPMNELLFNSSRSTVNEQIKQRNKQTLKRVLNYAQRMDTHVLRGRQADRLHAKSNGCGLEVPELIETLPQPEQEQALQMEAVGLSAVAKEELLGFKTSQGMPKPHWMHTKVLKKQLEQQFPQIERILEYMPRSERLQIDNTRYKINPEIKKVGEIDIKQISNSKSSSSSSSNNVKRLDSENISTSLPESHVYKVNDQLVVLGSNTPMLKNINMELTFQCEHLQIESKRVLRLENVCSNFLNCRWHCLPYYECALQMHEQEHVFKFENEPFRLLPGQIKQIHVRYMPNQIGINKLRLQLITLPRFFSNRTESLTIRLTGKCRPPQAHIQRLNAMEQQVCEKFKQRLIETMLCRVAEQVPLVQTLADKGCCLQPYARLPTERELFAALNPGYKCERLQALEQLKALHQRLKYPGEDKWDLQLQTLRALVLRQQQPQQRALALAQLLELLEYMRGADENSRKWQLHGEVQQRTCLFNVRGLMGACIDEWEDMICSVEQAFITTVLKNYEKEEAQQQKVLQWDAAQWHRHVCKQKVFLDSSYLQTSALLAQFMENLVSVIESAIFYE